MRRFLLLSALPVLVLAGCSSAVTGSGTFGAGSVSSAPNTASAPATPTTGVATPTPTPTPTAPSSSATPVGLAFTTVSFPVPSGFQPGIGYGEAIPLEKSAPIQDFIVPTGGQGGLNIISVIVYVLPGRVATKAQQIARVNSYNKRLRVNVVIPVRSAVVAGLPGLTERLQQPGSTKRGYEYSTYFVFGTTHLLQVSCQTATKAGGPHIVAGCRTVLAGLTVG